MVRVMRVVVSASLGSTVECAGSSRTSSKVSPRGANFSSSVMADSQVLAAACTYLSNVTGGYAGQMESNRRFGSAGLGELPQSGQRPVLGDAYRAWGHVQDVAGLFGGQAGDYAE